MQKRHPPLRDVYDALLRRFGPQRWWPARTRLEMCVGAILTQNTAWTNVVPVLRRLRAEGALNVRRLCEVEKDTLASWLRPAGCFNIKAGRVKAFAALVIEAHGGDLGRLLRLPPGRLREELLSVKGIGAETADCIILYAAKQPVFVVDTYTRRVLARHGWISGDPSYDEVAALFTRALPADPALFNEYHALLVAVGKAHCRRAPDCTTCPLRPFLPAGGRPRPHPRGPARGR